MVRQTPPTPSLLAPCLAILFVSGCGLCGILTGTSSRHPTHSLPHSHQSWLASTSLQLLVRVCDAQSDVRGLDNASLQEVGYTPDFGTAQGCSICPAWASFTTSAKGSCVYNVWERGIVNAMHNCLGLLSLLMQPNSTTETEPVLTQIKWSAGHDMQP